MDKNTELARLLKAASHAEPGQDETSEMPFGFDTRVLAHLRAQRSRSGWASFELATSTFRRVAATALTVAMLAGAGAYWQYQQASDSGEAFDNAYAIADNAIEAGVTP